MKNWYKKLEYKSENIHYVLEKFPFYVFAIRKIAEILDSFFINLWWIYLPTYFELTTDLKIRMEFETDLGTFLREHFSCKILNWTDKKIDKRYL